eukprot:TRINITY_DN485_c0_g6_i1.p1 TRINITY_DN485_c0_g6~~TRINITY_DN485_c0_g6_i1.p1  ORF type:complete len:519 (-),score=76.00 TRINITY_DN485_c0_g6_i1:929-2485(-)
MVAKPCKAGLEMFFLHLFLIILSSFVSSVRRDSADDTDALITIDDAFANRSLEQGTQRLHAGSLESTLFFKGGGGDSAKDEDQTFSSAERQIVNGYAPCCQKCLGQFCSPHSRLCHPTHAKSYYVSCKKQTLTQHCAHWCEGDFKGGNNKGRHCNGDMKNLCGGCSFCKQGAPPAPPPSPTPPKTCLNWCESDYKQGRNKGRHCGANDMANMCGGCGFCNGAAPAPTPAQQPPACQYWCEDDFRGGKNAGQHCGAWKDKCGGCNFCKEHESTPNSPSPSGGSGHCPNTGLKIRVMTYNLYWWTLFGKKGGGGSGNLIRDANKQGAIDFLGFQECDDVGRVMRMANLGGDYAHFSPGSSLGFAYRRSKWDMIPGSKGMKYVTQDAQNSPLPTKYKRYVGFARFKNKQNGMTVLFANFHGPLPNYGMAGGTERAGKLVNVLRGEMRQGDAVILVGDFNQGPNTDFVRHVSGNFLTKMYTGRSFGGVDHFFSSCPQNRLVSKRNLGGGGSDHDALTIQLKF